MNRARVMAVSADGPSSPAFRVRVGNLRPALADYGVDLEPWPLFTETEAASFFFANPANRIRALVPARRRQKRRLKSVDDEVSTTLIQRQADILGLRTLERKAIGTRRLVYDVDDAIWFEARTAGSSAFSALKRSASKARWLARRADQVIAGNEILAEHMARYASRVEVVPSLVDTAAIAMRQHEARPELVIGWIGSPSSARHLHSLAPTLERFADEVSPMPVILQVVGAKPPQVRGIEVRGFPWSREQELAALASMDIGLMPLADEPWTRGKCAYKALLYMAAGIPPVVSDVGVSARAVGSAGYVGRSPREWIEALTALASDCDLRSTLGSRGRERVESEYSVSRWAPELAKLLTAT